MNKKSQKKKRKRKQKKRAAAKEADRETVGADANYFEQAGIESWGDK